MRASFVILHYLAPEMTGRCIDTLLDTFRGAGVQLVVVDNGSPDGSGALLKERYAGREGISFVLLEANEGFARGNNAGYRYAVENFDPDFVTVMNNDVLIEDSGFLDTVAAEYARKPFAVLGPDIWSPAAGMHQSPTRLSPMTIGEVRRKRRIFSLKYRFYPLLHLWRKVAGGPHEAREARDNKPGEAHEGCVLHGACYIFSRDFTAKRGNAFNPATFLYTEEDILHYECSRDGLAMRYCPSLKVTHLEDVSTRAGAKSGFARARGKYRKLSDSLGVLLGLMKRDL